MKLYQGKYPIHDGAKYVCDYVYDNPSGTNYYYQLVRLSDNAILCAYERVNDIKLDCWRMGIAKAEVAFI